MYKANRAEDDDQQEIKQDIVPVSDDAVTFPWERWSAFRMVERTLSGDPLPGSFAPTGGSPHQNPARMQSVGKTAGPSHQEYLR